VDVFDMVADIARYPEFLPYWRNVRVITRTADGYLAEQEIGIGPICERFESQTVLDRPRQIQVASHCDMFRRFLIQWDFEPVADDACCVKFVQVCEARSLLVQTVLDVMLHDAARSTLRAFKKRARELHGEPNVKLGLCA
jgi:coenzyme Q-binding protein COQ10